MKMTLHEDNLTGRQPHRKTSHRQRKTTLQEDNLTGRPPPTKKTTVEEELEERKPHRQKNYNLIGYRSHMKGSTMLFSQLGICNR